MCVERGARGVKIKVLHCGIVVSEFELQSRYSVHFWTKTLGKCMDPFILPPMGLNVSVLFF